MLYLFVQRFHLRKSCINEELLAAGLGSLREVSRIDESADYADFVSRLARSEKMAKARGEGVWNGTEQVSIWNRKSTETTVDDSLPEGVGKGRQGATDGCAPYGIKPAWHL